MIQVTKQQFRKLTKIRQLLNEAESLFRQLPEEVQEEINESEDGDGMFSCIYRGAEVAQRVTETVKIKTA